MCSDLVKVDHQEFDSRCPFSLRRERWTVGHQVFLPVEPELVNPYPGQVGDLGFPDAGISANSLDRILNGKLQRFVSLLHELAERSFVPGLNDLYISQY